MILSSEKVISAFRKVRQVKEHKDLMCLDADRIPVSIEDLQYVVSDMYGVKIEKLDVRFESVFVRGMQERYADGRVRILIWANQSSTDKRFVTTKELCHVVIDEREDWTPQGSTTIDRLILESSLVFKDIADDEVQSEVLAEISAIELLCPFEYRDNDIEQLRSGTHTMTSIAAHYDVPEFVIGLALHPEYHEFANIVWQKVDKQGRE